MSEEQVQQWVDDPNVTIAILRDNAGVATTIVVDDPELSMTSSYTLNPEKT